jgi:hypothetical protein
MIHLLSTSNRKLMKIFALPSCFFFASNSRSSNDDDDDDNGNYNYKNSKMLNRSCMIFEDLLPYDFTILDICNWCRSHFKILCACHVAIAECRKIESESLG